jgi:hypothetical protein
MARQARVEGARTGGTREELVPIDKAEERRRLLFERINDVPVVDDMTTQIAVGAAAPQGQDEGRAKPAVQMLIVETHAQPVTDTDAGHIRLAGQRAAEVLGQPLVRTEVAAALARVLRSPGALRT